jgi:hypothetical protein
MTVYSGSRFLSGTTVSRSLHKHLGLTEKSKFVFLQVYQTTSAYRLAPITNSHLRVTLQLRVFHFVQVQYAFSVQHYEQYKTISVSVRGFFHIIHSFAFYFVTSFGYSVNITFIVELRGLTHCPLLISVQSSIGHRT